MRQSSENLDHLVFFWDHEGSQKAKMKHHPKITASTERRLEEYFVFLEDVVPSFTTQNDRHFSEMKPFTLD